MGYALRASLIWHDEVMDDVVCERGEPITLGATGATTFVTPDVGLPPEFTALRAGARGYVLTLGARMRGTICVGGATVDVRDFVGGEAFRATPIECTDWGVIDLDESGAHKLFFQFVPVDEDVPVVTRGMLAAGAAGWAIGSLVLTTLWLAKGLDFGEAVFRGAGLVSLAFGGAWLLHGWLRQDGESRASFVFSVLLHAAILLLTFKVYTHGSSVAYALPEQRPIVSSYVVDRVEDVRLAAALTTTTQTQPAIAQPVPQPIERAPVAPPRRDTAPSGHRRGVDGPSATEPGRRTTGTPADEILQGLVRHDVGDHTKKLGKLGRGEQDGPPGGDPLKTHDEVKKPGDTHGDHHDSQPPETVPVRPQVCFGECGAGTPATVDPSPAGPDEGPRLTPGEVERGIRARGGLFQACYQKAINHTAGLAGSVVVRFKIGPDGKVVEARRIGGTLANDEVSSCVVRNVRLLGFPAKGGANVTFPFVFQTSG